MRVHLRASPPHQIESAELGPLADLPGTWMGSGFNLIFLPDQHQMRPFRVKMNATREVLEIEPIGGPIPNRGSVQDDIQFLGLHYLQRVSDAVTNEALHIEPGLWLSIPATESPQFPAMIVRQATIPHGDSLLAMGQSAAVAGPPTIGTISSMPTRHDGNKFPIGYLDPFLTAAMPAGISADAKDDPNVVLKSAIVGQNIVNTVTLSLSTTPNGGILNIPFILKNANATRFDATFYLETIVQSDGCQFVQLQYTQTVILDFLDIDWPHISVATLVKQ